MLVVASVVFTKDIIIRDSTQYCTAKTAGNVQLTVQVKNAARELLLELAVVVLELRGGGVVAQDRRACLARDGRLEVVVESGSSSARIHRLPVSKVEPVGPAVAVPLGMLLPPPPTGDVGVAGAVVCWEVMGTVVGATDGVDDAVPWRH